MTALDYTEENNNDYILFFNGVEYTLEIPEIFQSVIQNVRRNLLHEFNMVADEEEDLEENAMD
jgi:hypothetical protein